MKTALRFHFALVAILIVAFDQASAQALNKRQLCEGVVAFDEDGMLQLMDTKNSSSLWCNAYIGEDRDSPLAKAVISQCPVGSRCVIDGLFSGRGVFYWTKILSARPH